MGSVKNMKTLIYSFVITVVSCSFDQAINASTIEAQINDASVEQCGNLFIPNAQRLPSAFDSVSRYQCLSGYLDMANGTVRCVDGKWTPPPEKLCLKTCPDLSQLNAVMLIDRLPNGETSSRIVNSRDVSMMAVGSKLRVFCTGSNGHPKKDVYFLACLPDGQWRIITKYNGSGDFLIHVQVEKLCLLNLDNDDKLPILSNKDACLRFSPDPTVNIRYSTDIRNGIQVGTEAYFNCVEPSHVLSQRQPWIRLCESNGQWSDSRQPRCIAMGCERPPVTTLLKPIYETKEGNNLSGRDAYFTEVGSVKNLYWYTGLCESPGAPSNGFYNYNPNVAKFSPGQILSFGCEEGYRLDGSMHLKCLDNGVWTSAIPQCRLSDWSNKRFITLMSIASILGTLLLAMVTLVLLKQILLKRFHFGSRIRRLSGVHPAGGGIGLMSAAPSGHGVFPGNTARCVYNGDLDRLALIRFADDIQPNLPSYEEAISRMVAQRRAVPCFDSLSTLSGYCSRALRRLPSLSSLRSRDAVRSLREHPNFQTSNSNVSHGLIGSSDTVTNTSDSSTAVTLDTVGSGYSNSSSNRPQAGSLSSVTSGPYPGTVVINSNSNGETAGIVEPVWRRTRCRKERLMRIQLSL
ncbi:putative sushi domain (SCR repeat) [Trichinella spiralis]|uniref:putative sushi domain (SCR repeat) n=1 Tax=Trichinella spiralis TaxID=6334 RepID=UPI0001EFC991|nr:putative sushi domain (SCR repeat) [Trichinella spiralis]